MNKIIVKNYNIEKLNISKNIFVEWKEEYVPKLKITISKTTSLELDITSEETTKLNIEIIVLPKVECHLLMRQYGYKNKILMNYDLSKESHLYVTKLVDVQNVNQRDIINLNEKNAQIHYILKTACTNSEKYDLIVNHNAENTVSMLTNHGINLEKGNLTFNVSTCIPEGNKGCIADQNNRIINLTNKTCIIRPNLFIDEYDVIANHSAHIGSIKEEEVFYLQRLGIPYEEATKLLLQGFMKSLVDEKIIIKMFSKYWR